MRVENARTGGNFLVSYQANHSLHRLALINRVGQHRFEARVRDWAAHHSLLIAFWSSLLRGTRRFHGAPVSCHLGIPGLTEAMFLRWLVLFRQTTAECGNEPMRREADDAALRMANHFWQRYQVKRICLGEPMPLPAE